MLDRLKDLKHLMVKLWSARTQKWGSPARPRDAAPGASLALSDRDVVVARLMLLTYLVALAMVGFTVGVVVHLGEQGREQCDDSREHSCPVGLECVAGTCIEADIMPDCALGTACDGTCACEGTNACDEADVCRPIQPLTECEQPAVIALLQQLQTKHRACEAAAGTPMVGCEPQDVAKYLIQDAKFREIETHFKDVTIFTFPEGKPGNRGLLGEVSRGSNAWPDPDTEKSYTRAVAQAMPFFKDAATILMFGRATTTQHLKNDYTYAQSRVEFVKDMLIQASSDDQVERSKFAAKILDFSLGGQSRATLEDLADNGHRRIITYRKFELSQVSKALAQRKNKTLTAAARARVEGPLNRSVMVIAIPCAVPPAQTAAD